MKTFNKWRSRSLTMPSETQKQQHADRGFSVTRLLLLGSGALLGAWVGLKTGLALAKYSMTGNWSFGYIGTGIGAIVGGAAGQLASAKWEKHFGGANPQRRQQSVKEDESLSQRLSQEQNVAVGKHTESLMCRRQQHLDLLR
jgi:hypothetical protein